MSDEKTPPEPWSVKRWKQLEKLDRLLIECESLDTGNCILWRIKTLIAGAKKMRQWEHGRREQSFIQFLRERARHEYPKRKRSKRKPSTEQERK